jgi:RNA polymerase sigma factor (sigma-70 family)
MFPPHRPVRSPRTERPIVGVLQLIDATVPAVGNQIESYPPGSDESLLAGLVAKDADLEAAFVRRFQGRVYGLARLLVGEAQLAEDVAQEAFLRAWRHAPNFDPRRGSVTTWLHTITRNLAIDALRRRRAVPVNVDMLILEPDPQAKAPDEAAANADADSRLRDAIRHLPLEQRRAVMLAFFYGQTAREISIADRIPLGTAKTRIRLGITKLRAALEEADIGQPRCQEQHCSTTCSVP